MGIATSVIYSKENERPGRDHKIVCVGVSGDGRSVGVERMLEGVGREDQAKEVDKLVAEVTDAMRGKAEGRGGEGFFDVTSGVEHVHSAVAKGECESGMLWPYAMEMENGWFGEEVVVVPGSFNPLHVGHLEMGKVTGEENKEVWFELSLGNADKPTVTLENLLYRLEEFGKLAAAEGGGEGKAEGEGMKVRLMCTAEPFFAGKAKVLKDLGAERVTFVVGSDTFVRIVDVKYYDSKEAMEEMLEGWRRDGISFVVCPRGDITGNPFQDDRGLSRWLNKHEFWSEVSSSAIREGVMDAGGTKL